MNIKTSINNNTDMESRLQAAVFMIRTLQDELEKAKNEKSRIIKGWKKYQKDSHEDGVCYVCCEWFYRGEEFSYSCKLCGVEHCDDCVEKAGSFSLWFEKSSCLDGDEYDEALDNIYCDKCLHQQKMNINLKVFI